MEVLWWLLIAVAFVLGFVGVIVPVIPSILLFWIGFFIYHFALDSSAFGWIFWVTAAVLTILVLFSDVIANSIFVKRFGGTKLGEYAAVFGVLIGMFVYPPIGIIVVPIIAVFAVELYQSKDYRQSIRASIGSLIAFLASSLFMLLVYIFLVIWFLLWIFVF